MTSECNHCPYSDYCRKHRDVHPECQVGVGDLIRIEWPDITYEPRERRLTILEKYLAESTTFFTDPASVKHHGNFKGGLAKHSHAVWRNLTALTNKLNLRWKDRDSPRIIALCHDMCKIGAYIDDGNGGYTYAYPKDRGHGDVSVQLAKRIIDLTDEEEACIRWHMGAYDKRENWNGYNDALRKFPNVLWTHTADMMAAHFDEVKKESDGR